MDKNHKHDSIGNVLTPAEYHKIIYDWNQTDKDYPRNKTIHQLFEEQAARTPDNIAVVFEDQKLTWQELNEQSNQLARFIRQHYKSQGHELKPDTLIALCLDRSLDMIIAILAVLKAGGAYVPIDPGYPNMRIQYILTDTTSTLLLTQHHLEEQLQRALPEHITLQAINDKPYLEFGNQALSSITKSTDLAYVIYTSGTTGLPKGVMIEHRNLVNTAFSIKEALPALSGVEKIAQVAAYTFDTFCLDYALSWCFGHELHILSGKNVLDLHLMAEYFAKHRITYTDLPTALYQLLDHIDSTLLCSLKYLVCGGEKLKKSIDNKQLDFVLINAYGPTEATVESHLAIYPSQINHVKINGACIGKAIGNVKSYILDKKLNPVPIGTTGELFLGGAGLARGYLNLPELTQQRFISNPFATEQDKAHGYTRLYNTGDFVRYLPDSTIEYIGRKDLQVKIHGFRVELNEIEQALSTFPEIKQNVVLAREKESGLYLVAYYTSNRIIKDDQLIKHLTKQLPKHMIPGTFVRIHCFPLTTNGKLDRAALPDPDFIASDASYVEPRSEFEKQLCLIWQDTLGVSRVGILDDFFKMGGDSILSIQATSRMRQQGIDCSVKAIFECRCIKQLSLALTTQSSAIAIRTEQGKLHGHFGLLPIQSWFFEQHKKRPNYWNQAFMIKVPALSIERLKLILPVLIAQHDMLRACFIKKENGVIEQAYQLSPEINIHELNVSTCSTDELEATLTTWQAGFDIEHGPLWSIGYLHGYPDGSSRLHMAFHYLIIDTVSVRILIDDIKWLYEGKLPGKKSNSYRRWIATVNDYARHHPHEIDYWQGVLANSTEYPAQDLSTTPQHGSIVLNKQTTHDLLSVANNAYHTEINDLLLTALAYALMACDNNRSHTITLEGHGREPIDETIDTSRTVGWFTTTFPVKLTVQDTLDASIKSIKEHMHAIPAKGIGFGALQRKSMGTRDALTGLPPIEFNYLGQFDTPFGNWQVVNESPGCTYHPDNSNPFLINITGMVIHGELRFTIITRLDAAGHQRLIQTFQEQLNTIINHCVSNVQHNELAYTPSDFNAVTISEEVLDKLQVQYDIETLYPATSLQQGFIYYVLSLPNDDAYRVQTLFDYHGELDVSTYKKAWLLAIQTYPSLRLCFNWDEELIQIITKTGQLDFTEHDIRHIDDKDKIIKDIQLQDRATAFDLTQPSLFRIHLFKHHETLHTLLINLHHSINDGWSGPVLLHRVHDYYYTLKLRHTPNVVKDASYRLAQEWIVRHQTEADTWALTQIKGIEHANDINALLSNHTDLDSIRALKIPRDSKFTFTVDEYAALKALQTKTGLTLNVFVQFAWHKLIQLYTRDTTTIVGTVLSGRSIPITGIENSVGLYINTLPLILNWNQGASVLQQLNIIHEKINALNEHCFAHLTALQTAGKHLFYNVLVFEIYPLPKMPAKDEHHLDVRFRAEIEKLDTPLALMVREIDTELQLGLKYDETCLTPQKAEQLLLQLQHIINQLPATLDLPEHAISLLTPAEYQTITHDWNKTDKNYPRDKTIHQLFEQQAARTPNHIAVVFENQQLTYQSLNEQANQLARFIRQHYKQQGHQFTPDTLIALCLDRSLDMIIAILAVLKAGGAYVPIDPDYPDMRIQAILEDTATKLVLTQRHFTKNWGSIPIICIDGNPAWHKLTKTNLPTHNKATDLAYVLYTSGTTGKPKGVAIEHRGIINRITWMQNQYPLTAQDVVLHKTPYTFDVSVWELLWANWYGAKMVIAKPEGHKDNAYLHQLIIEKNVTVVHFVPSMLSAFTDYLKTLNEPIPPALRHIFSSGEALSAAQVKEIYSLCHHEVAVHNLYGPTETSIDSTWYDCQPDEKTVYIGKPVQNNQVYVLDDYQNPVPIGVIGELYIGGAGLARGYLNQPGLTAERFIPNPFATPANKSHGYTRLYKTGDLVKWLSNGNLEYIGRNDFQVKIRGFRIELGEIEHALATCPGIKQNVVVAKDKETGKYLVAYYTSDTSLDNEQLIAHLKTQLPEYMIPVMFVRMDSFPLTNNGKLDRGALPDPDFKENKAIYVPPGTDLEVTLCSIWQDLLNLERVGITDNFFSLGGHSILAIQLSNKISKVINKQVPVSDIFQYKTIAGLASILQSRTDSIKIDVYPEDIAPLSYEQARTWFIERYESGTNAYNIPFAFELDATVNRDALKEAIQSIIKRHSVLRTVFIQDANGVDYQTVCDKPLRIVEERITLNELPAKLNEACNTIFNLIKDYPIKAWLYDVMEEPRTLLVFNIHHVAFDEWSFDIFIHELQAWYEHHSKGTTLTLPAITIQYKDFAAWQHMYLSSERIATQIRYWQKTLRGYEHTQFPTDYTRPALINYQGEEYSFKLNETLSSELRALSQSLGVSLYTVLFSGLYVLLAKYTGQQDLIIGTPIANRDYIQVESLIGFFVNSFAIRVQLKSDDTLSALIEQLQHQLINARQNQDLPFEQLIEAMNVVRDPSRHPLFQIMFDITHDNGKPLAEPLFHYIPLDDHYKVSKFDFGLVIDESPLGLSGTINYATSLYTPETITRLATYYERILQQMVDDIDSKIQDYQLLSPAEYQQIVYDWNATEFKFPHDKSIHQLFEEQAAQHPQTIAVVFKEQALTYKELDHASNQLARFIQKQYPGNTLKPDTVIALCLDRSIEMLIGILGILKAGGAYVPIDPNYPVDRIRFMLEDTGCTVLLTQQQLMNKLEPVMTNPVTLDTKPYQHEPVDPLPAHSKPTDLAYMMYTSGTTGIPKGVLINHSAVTRFIEAFSQLDVIQPIVNKPFSMLGLTSYIFDIFGLEYGVTLTHGGTLVLSDLEHVEDAVSKHPVDLIQQTPSVWRQLLERLPAKALYMTTCLVGGEAPDDALIENLKQQCAHVLAVYGPTETTIWSTSHLYNNSSNARIIGTPLAGEHVYVLDDNQKPVPIGVKGELYIGGTGLARGYLNQTALTAEYFIPNPFNDRTRLYKTGDLVKWLPDGNLEYIGRNDFQVKIRGFRIELGEIEHALSMIPGIKQSVLMTREKETGLYLVAYYTSDTIIDSKQLISHLQTRLPDHMIPSAFVQMDTFPLTISGKLDRAALPEPDYKTDKTLYVAPETDSERITCEIWSKALNIPLKNVGVYDDFFSLGGNSLLSLQVVHHMKQHGIPVTLANIFVYRNIKNICNQHNNFNELEDCSDYVSTGSSHEKTIIFIPNFFEEYAYYNFINKLKTVMNVVVIKRAFLYEDNVPLENIANHYAQIISSHFPTNKAYYLAGYSMGGNIVDEIARKLKNTGVIAGLIFFDTWFYSYWDYAYTKIKILFNILSNKPGYRHKILKIETPVLLFKTVKREPFSWNEHLGSIPNLLRRIEFTLNHLLFSGSKNNIPIKDDLIKIVAVNCEHGDMMSLDHMDFYIKHILEFTNSTHDILNTMKYDERV